MDSLPYAPAENAPIDRNISHAPDDLNMNDDTQLTMVVEGTKAKGPSTPDASPGARKPLFDPAALLNPKAAAKKAKDDPTPKDIQSKDLTDLADANADASDVDFGGMIERQHGVTKREAIPRRDLKHLMTRKTTTTESVRNSKVAAKVVSLASTSRRNVKKDKQKPVPPMSST